VAAALVEVNLAVAVLAHFTELEVLEDRLLAVLLVQILEEVEWVEMEDKLALITVVQGAVEQALETTVAKQVQLPLLAAVEELLRLQLMGLQAQL